MAKTQWPEVAQRSLLGQRISRVDGPLKSTGAAKYSYDQNRPGMLWARVVWSPHAKAEVAGIDTSAAEALKGVKAVYKDNLKEVLYAGQILAAVAAETEEIAVEAAGLIKVNDKVGEHVVKDTDPELSKERPSKRETGNVDEAMGKAELVHSGSYGLPVITHCCLEPHGQIIQWKAGTEPNNAGDQIMVWPSTQNVPAYAGDLGTHLKVPVSNIKVKMDYIGGGFGSKFNPDAWAIVGAELSKKAGGRPVHLYLDRSAEEMIGVNLP